MTAPPRDPRAPNLMTLVALAGVSALTMSVLLPSLPQIAAHFGTDYAFMQLSVSAYFAVTGLLQLAIGPLADRFGRRPVVLGAVGIFVLADIACIYAPSGEAFIAARLVQGAVVAGMALSRTIIRDIAPPERAASLIGYVTMGMAIAPMMGPAIGGWLGQSFGWQAIFWFLAALGAGLFALCWADLHETQRERAPDLTRQLRETPELIRARRFWGYVLTSALAAGTYYAYLGGAPIVAARIYGQGEAMTGLLMGLISLGYIGGNFLSGRLAHAWGMQRMILTGTLVATGCIAIAGLGVAAGITHPLMFFGAMIGVGLGNGMTLPSASVGLMNIRPRLAGTASGVGGAFMVIGGGALSAITGIIGQWGTTALPLIGFLGLVSAASVASGLWVRALERAAAARPA
ncbi:MAG: Bcr/CflA family efflux MFS transporter [Alphaproteobacteria bacterium]|nr:MAG: Bcr/CflA family efflux MFS transporter [Alphaproteobacteria bacterium]